MGEELQHELAVARVRSVRFYADDDVVVMGPFQDLGVVANRYLEHLVTRHIRCLSRIDTVDLGRTEFLCVTDDLGVIRDAIIRSPAVRKSGSSRRAWRD